ncbi:NADP-dependent phosphogluconate dehydrogenase [Photobacterium sp. TY1-4]|uniref:NADP-dependent phosphogluconate dehydrogenase n=1 Tax=Photobacterium sp. TY1-4 TaxID=2899122 RepID=UPI0021C21BBD|nr:NADP-dependent phosphogluconate dehydrogenase [Photobacterium sp. TY1-4]UXI03154.1 NADP-dependent phosphogluconate dehydrogenase [Photobacterium sp. TY1-4]
MHNAEIAMIGLGVMGKSLALNLIDHGFQVAGFDLNPDHVARTEQGAAELAAAPGRGRFVAAVNLTELLAKLATPRVIALSVPAGAIVDQVTDELLAAGLQPEDIVIDTGNSLWTDTEARERRYQGKLRFFSTAVSGGEAGARLGPSLMASGDASAWQYVKPMWHAIAAKVDAEGMPVGPFDDGEACAAYLGPAGAGHYVKMVHNGIEYADMQLICEVYHYLSEVLAMPAAEIGQVFARWNQGVLNSYLMEISADILQTRDPETGAPFVEVVLDKAGQKGTGLWTAVNSLQEGSPAPTIAQAVFARAMSSQKSQRTTAAALFNTHASPVKTQGQETVLDQEAVLRELHDALYCAKLAVYAQGFDLLKTTSERQGWQLDFAAIAKIWRAGCIIRAIFLQQVTAAYQQNPALENLLFAEHFRTELAERATGWRSAVANAALQGVPMPGIGSAQSYFDALRCAVLPANLLQAQRDYFGSHTYSRTDQPEADKFHLTWSTTPRVQQAQ